jgi:RND family efflux transporter MFP subunit
MTPDPLYTIADLATVYVTADVFEYEAGAVRVGATVTFTLPYLARKTFTGRVAAILPIADPTSHTVKVRTLFDNPGYSLKPEMYGDLTIEIAETRRLTIPQEAVLDTGLRRIVFVDRGEGYLEPKEVVTGQQFGDRIEVLDGLQAGQKIVISGNFLIDSESQLTVRGAD